MAKLVFGMNQDDYVDHTAFAPGPILFRHFILARAEVWPCSGIGLLCPKANAAV